MKYARRRFGAYTFSFNILLFMSLNLFYWVLCALFLAVRGLLCMWFLFFLNLVIFYEHFSISLGNHLHFNNYNIVILLYCLNLLLTYYGTLRLSHFLLINSTVLILNIL